MAPIKSSLARSVAKLLGVQQDSDLSLRGQTQTTRFIDTAFQSSGGTKIIDGNDVLHVFTQPGTLTFEGGYGDAKVLLVGGGGSGGGHESNGHYAMGGGGAGGMISLTGQNYNPGTYPVTIGLGGQPQSGHGDARPGNPGSPTTALGLTAWGGGSGGGGPTQAGGDGGSGVGGGDLNKSLMLKNFI